MMDYIHRLPFILSAFMTVIVGAISFKYNNGMQDIYIRMSISMVCFYIIGTLIRGSILKIEEEVERKRKEEERARQEELERQQQEENLRNEADKVSGNNIDYRVEDDGEDFQPLFAERDERNQ
ncbi:MAG: hypothetical protein N2645_09050 [Clostridia bacterium]|nr:hypothetical protein [Clostridia bacterium]